MTAGSRHDLYFISYSYCCVVIDTKIDDDKIDHQEISTFTDEIVYVLHRTIQSQRASAENKI